MTSNPSPDDRVDPGTDASRPPGEKPDAPSEGISHTRPAPSPSDSTPASTDNPSADKRSPDRTSRQSPAGKNKKAKPPKPSSKTPEPAASGRSLGALLTQMPSWLVSAIVHLLLVIALLWFQLPEDAKQDLRNLVALSDTEDKGVDSLHDAPPEPEPVEVAPSDVTPETNTVTASESSIATADDVAAAATNMNLQEFGAPVAPREGNTLRIGAAGSGAGGGFGNRTGPGRRGALRQGASKGSEAAVALALKWLADHQMPDGGWSFAHQLSPKCHGQCGDPGTMANERNAATAMALLPFLGAGQTHLQGEYKKTVRGGLYFLAKRMNPKTGSLREPRGTMYSHGLSAIALCEAYGMTRDRELLPPVQGAITFIGFAQDPVGGGWRYVAPAIGGGDTSVVGWQIMALKSADMAYVPVPAQVVNRSRAFLDSVQFDDGSRYGYTMPRGGTAATTAIGLLCRMYLGWKKTEPGLVKGVEWLDERGPSTDDMYYNYYATQVMHHWEGKEWKRWNAAMRDQLVDSQAKKGHETGSWYMPDDHFGAKPGGRLYCTALATMILEVYYRHMPIYAKRSTAEDFPID